MPKKQSYRSIELCTAVWSGRHWKTVGKATSNRNEIPKKSEGARIVDKRGYEITRKDF